MEQAAFKKIGQLTPDMLKAFKRTKAKARMLGLSKGYAVGDSSVAIMHGEVGEIYEQEWRGQKHYYVVMAAVSAEISFCITFYPVSQ